jgi:hypothetical protein
VIFHTTSKTNTMAYAAASELRALDALDRLVATGLTYPGWQADVRKAEEYHVEYPNLMDGHMLGMRHHQALHTGDRTHSQLRALDALIASGLTYPGWEADVGKAEEVH